VVCGSVRIDSIDCNRLQSRYEELYSSFHVCEKVNAADFERAVVVLNDTESWPDGALIRRYFRPTPKHGEPTGQIRICSFNCRSLKNSLAVVYDLCNSHDIVLLQEHWLIPNDMSSQ